MPSNPPGVLVQFWSDLPLPSKAAIATGLPLLFLSAVALISLSSTALRENEAQLWVDDTIAVQIGKILNILLETEGETRSSLISRQADFRPRLTVAQTKVEAEIDHLENLIRNNAIQLAEIGSLRSLRA